MVKKIFAFAFIAIVMIIIVASCSSDKNETQAALNDQQKSELKSFYTTLIALPKDADEAYGKWSKSFSDSNTTKVYLDADVVISANNDLRSKVSGLAIPNVPLSSENKKLINDAKLEISTAYFVRNEAIEEAKKYINTNDLEAMANFKKKTDQSGAHIISALSNLLKVMQNTGVEVTDIK